MKTQKKIYGAKTGKAVTKHFTILAGCLLFVLLMAAQTQAQPQWPRMVPSKDGTPISYEVFGEGEPTLVFVHGWSCDARYWRAQVAYFSSKHRVIVLDLAGHGHSGLARKTYSMAAFGEDVRAVVDAAGLPRVVLIGHSMGGAVIAEAARLLTGKVIGLIGVDTLANIEYPLTRKEFRRMIAPLEKDFKAGSRQFVGQMMLPDTDARLREWILSDMSAAPPAVALSAMNEMMRQYVSGEAAAIFDQIRLPVITVNGDLWPINYEGNRRHMLSYDAIVMRKSDHFLMMNQPEAFNPALEQAIAMLIERSGRQKDGKVIR